MSEWEAPKQEQASSEQQLQEALAKKDLSKREWRLIEKLVMGLFQEQRRARRWGIFFKFLTFGYLAALLMLAFLPGWQQGQVSPKEHTALVDIRGVIADEEDANAEVIIQALRDAYDEPTAKAVILHINSPGGSPVQAGYIYDEIIRLRTTHPQKPLYAVISDIGASGGYYVAAAADKIYADKASLVGSIGVISAGFGFVGLMDKLGIERRALTAGEYKNFLDPFSPRSAKVDELWQQVLDTTHKQFIEQVQRGRGERLKESPELFSGLVWTGQQALQLGLIDALASVDTVARDVVGAPDLVNYRPEPSRFEQLAKEFGVMVGEGMARILTQSHLQLR
ncbi:signal peptide peptidase SppA [Balneatrix alpica]|uniref:Signal peptide peptidase SppA n=1 Tax=Balneatrix alpica TaxID=75684 RepID=A0ABV5ZAF6_9GAMM|nr:signal peptide peptidase SppA [Balneatrix alpica]